MVEGPDPVPCRISKVLLLKSKTLTPQDQGDITWVYTNLSIHTRVYDTDVKGKTERGIHTGKQTCLPLKHLQSRLGKCTLIFVLKENLSQFLKIAPVQISLRSQRIL